MQPNPEKAAYGFASWIASWALLALYTAWGLGLIPQAFNLPSEYWALGGAAVLTLAMMSYLLAVPILAMASHHPPHSMYNVTDKDAHTLPLRSDPNRLPPMGDIPIYTISQMLYANRAETSLR